jgi:ribosomal protein S27AE
MAFKKYSGGFDYQPKVNCPKCGKLYQYWKDGFGQPHFYCGACGYTPGLFDCSTSSK